VTSNTTLYDATLAVSVNNEQYCSTRVHALVSVKWKHFIQFKSSTIPWVCS